MKKYIKKIVSNILCEKYAIDCECDIIEYI